MTQKIQFKAANPKVDFVAMEKQLLDYWYGKGIVRDYLTKNTKSSRKFSFLDGPITANNPMGVHHAWGRTYKDLFQRFYNMRGFRQRFQNGFDEQGLWVEVEVEKELGFKNKKDIERFGVDRFVNLCKERVKKYSQIQTEQSKRLGYFMDWDHSYHTSSDENNYAIWHFLKVCHQLGYLYKGRDSVPWCPRCGTAISQHEILTEEYKEITHDAIYLLYPIMTKGWENVYLRVWTTTPWTVPGNVAIAVHPDFNYGLYSEDGVKKIELKREGKNYQQVLKGQELVGLHYKGAFDAFERVRKAQEENPQAFHLVIPAKDLVKENEGTGLVHIAPGAGEEDFKLGKEFNLPTIELIDESAVYLKGLGELSGKNAKENPKLIIDFLSNLKDSHNLRFFERQEKYTHRYPVCWRCKTELVWRVVDEWYIAMDRLPSGNSHWRATVRLKTLRQQMIEVAKQIQWIPQFGLERELDWLGHMHDWLISKKRYWGLALPIWECLKCGHFEVIGSREELKEKAVEGWEKFAGHSPHRPWVDMVKIRCSQCQNIINRIPDVGNPWLDAGIVPFSTMPSDWFPADFITESFPGQFKNWFYSLIAMSTVLTGKRPFKTVLGFASLLDEKGEEMHKSKGNAIEFNKAADKIGVDVMRWMYLSQNPAVNLLFGYQKAEDVRRRFYLILWNVYVFFTTYANLDQWQPPQNFDDNFQPKHILDFWILSKLAGLIDTVTQNLEAYQPHVAANAIEDFVVDKLSTWYIRRSRDRVGPTAIVNEANKESFYQTAYRVLVKLCQLAAPFLPFISEEMFINLTGLRSVHLTDWPKSMDGFINKGLEAQMDYAREIVAAAHALRKASKIKVRQPLAKLTYKLDSKLDDDIEQVIAEEVNVKKVVFNPSQKANVLLDTRLNKRLQDEGLARELVRQIQELRKKAKCDLSQKIVIIAPHWPKQFENYILHQTLAVSIQKGDSLKIQF